MQVYVVMSEVETNGEKCLHFSWYRLDAEEQARQHFIDNIKGSRNCNKTTSVFLKVEVGNREGKEAYDYIGENFDLLFASAKERYSNE